MTVTGHVSLVGGISYVQVMYWGTWTDGIETAMSERGLRMGKWNNRRQWSMEVGRRPQMFYNREIYIYIFIH
jgi:hypothetical protein